MAPRQPVFFIGHGSPMNAIEENTFTAAWKKIGKNLHVPQAVVCVSAHWVTRGTEITAHPQPKTIHDFGGFPPALYEVEYPAPGSFEIAQLVQETLKPQINARLTDAWGLDHGAWSILMHIFPDAKIPVLQLSIDATLAPQAYFDMGTRLKKLRAENILFIGSGNIVHNLRLVDWTRFAEKDYALPWARKADRRIVELIRSRNFLPLIQFQNLGEEARLAINSAEHYVPLLYVLGLSDEDDTLSFFNEEAVAGALTMTSVRFG
ncbi:MAG TPA: 4,5-DOPA dioxygenase extradiol [Turneriella sp.]|nr:4,5-DOPA dioxygenase extradiol [Turneriella sp.]